LLKIRKFETQKTISNFKNSLVLRSIMLLFKLYVFQWYFCLDTKVPKKSRMSECEVCHWISKQKQGKSKVVPRFQRGKRKRPCCIANCFETD